MSSTALTQSQPRYLQMARSLLAEITAGRYPVGSKLPNELDLCEQFGASRFTVRAAIDKLAKAGIVSRKPRVGTVVEAAEARARGELSVGSLEDIQQFGSRTVMQVLEKKLVSVPAHAPAPLGAHAGETWLYVEGLRSSPQSPGPLCFNEVWVSPDYRGVAGVEGSLNETIWSLVESQFSVVMASVQQDIRATALSPRAAKAMGLKRGSPALYVRRAYYDDKGHLIELAVSIHPPDSFVYSLSVERRSQTNNPRGRSL